MSWRTPTLRQRCRRLCATLPPVVRSVPVYSLHQAPPLAKLRQRRPSSDKRRLSSGQQMTPNHRSTQGSPWSQLVLLCQREPFVAVKSSTSASTALVGGGDGEETEGATEEAMGAAGRVVRRAARVVVEAAEMGWRCGRWRWWRRAGLGCEAARVARMAAVAMVVAATAAATAVVGMVEERVEAVRAVAVMGEAKGGGDGGGDGAARTVVAMVEAEMVASEEAAMGVEATEEATAKGAMAAAVEAAVEGGR